MKKITILIMLLCVLSLSAWADGPQLPIGRYSMQADYLDDPSGEIVIREDGTYTMIWPDGFEFSGSYSVDLEKLIMTFPEMGTENGPVEFEGGHRALPILYFGFHLPSTYRANGSFGVGSAVTSFWNFFPVAEE